MSEATRHAAATDREHGERMRALQAEQRAKVARASNPDRGLVLVHTGNGKGKSSAAFGVVARALGWGKRVGVVQFIKGTWKTGERQFFSRFPDLLEWRTTGSGIHLGHPGPGGGHRHRAIGTGRRARDDHRRQIWTWSSWTRSTW